MSIVSSTNIAARPARSSAQPPRVSMVEPRPFLASETALAVRFADVDSMHVAHHTAYLHWFEQVRFHFLDHLLGIDYGVLESEGVAVPLVTCSVRYRKPIRFGDRPVAYARIEPARNALLTFHYHLFRRAGGELCATGTTTHCYLGHDQRLLLWTPPVLTRAFDALVEREPDCVWTATDQKGTSDA